MAVEAVGMAAAATEEEVAELVAATAARWVGLAAAAEAASAE